MKSSDRFRSVALFLILATATVLRFAGTNFGLPYLYHQDEPIVVNHALAYGTGDLNPHFFKIPPLLSYLLFGLYGISFLFWRVISGVTPEAFAEYFFRDPTFFYWSGRLVFGALLGTASVWVLYRIGCKAFSRPIGLWAALFFATSFLPVRDSHYLYADVPMIFAILVSMNCLAKFMAEGQACDYRLAAGWAGVAIAFKYIAAPVVLPLVAAALSRPEEGAKRWRRAFAGLALCGIVYLLLNPFSFIDFPFFLKEIRQQATAEGSMPFFHHLTYSLFEGHGMAAVLAGLAGFTGVWLSEPRRRWLFSFPLVFYLMTAVFSQPYERYAMPIVPFLCLGAAWLVGRIAGRLRRWGVVFTVAAAVFLAGSSIAKSIAVDKLFLMADTRTTAADWIERNLPEDSTIVLDHSFFSPEIRQTQQQLLEKMGNIHPDDPHRQAKIRKIELSAKVGWPDHKAYRVFYLNEEGLEHPPFSQWSPFLRPDAAAFERERIQYYVRYRYPGESDFFERRVKDRMELVKTFSPYRDPQKIFTEDKWAHVAFPFQSRELFSRLSPGPYLEIYRMKSP